MLQEFGKHDKEPAKYVKQWKGNNSKTGAPFSCDIGYERFLAPEVSVWTRLAKRAKERERLNFHPSIDIRQFLYLLRVDHMLRNIFILIQFILF